MYRYNVDNSTIIVPTHVIQGMLDRMKINPLIGNTILFPDEQEAADLVMEIRDLLDGGTGDVKVVKERLTKSYNDFLKDMSVIPDREKSFYEIINEPKPNFTVIVNCVKKIYTKVSSFLGK